MIKAPTIWQQSWVQALTVLIIFALIGFSIYGAALNNEFVLDDETQISGNAMIQNWHLIPSLFSGSTNKMNGSKRLAGIYYKPLLSTAYALLWMIDGSNTSVFHGFQVLLHLLNAWLIFLFFCRFLGVKTAFFTGLFFLVHPVNTEVAIYSADLQDTMYFFFGILGLLVVSLKPKLGKLRTLGLAFLLLMSLLCKESGILFVIGAVLWGWTEKDSSAAQPSIACIFALSLYSWLRFGWAGLYDHVGISWAHMGHVSLAERLLTLPLILIHYACIFIYPFDLTTTQDWVIKNASVKEFWLPLGGVLMILLSSFWLLKKLKPKEPVIFLSLLAAAGLALHAQVLPLDGTVADRWLYVTVFAVLGLLGMALKTAIKQNWFLGILVGLVLVLSITAHQRSLDWRNGMTLYAHDAALDPQNGLLQNNLGVELYRKGDRPGALSHFELAVQLSPHWNIPWNNLGAAQESFGHLAQAETSYRASIDRGVYDLAYENYPRLLMGMGKRDEALRFIETIGLPALPNNSTLLAFRADLRGAK